MKHRLKSLRLGLVRGVMELMALLSRVVQVRHPHGRAPRLRPVPAMGETLGTFEGGKVYAFDQGIISGERGGLAISGRNEVFENLTQYFRGAKLHPGLVRLRVPPARKLPGVGAYLCTPQARANYYHWMIDLIPRLWLLEQAGFTPATVDHVFINGDNRPWETEPLLAYGFRPVQIHNCTEHDRFQVDRLIVPDRIQDPETFAPWKATFLRRLFPASTEPPSRLLFCGRKDATWRRLVNESELFDRLQPLGFEVVDTSGKSVADQARLFSSARIIVAVHGATLTNLVFTPPNALLIEIQSRESPRAFYSGMCAAIGVRSVVVLAEPTRRGTDPTDLHRVDFTLSAGQLDSILTQVEKELAS